MLRGSGGSRGYRTHNKVLYVEIYKDPTMLAVRVHDDLIDDDVYDKMLTEVVDGGMYYEILEGVEILASTWVAY